MSPTSVTSPCRSCGARVVWATTEAGRRIPVDPEPVHDGNIQLDAGPDGPIAHVIARASVTGQLLPTWEATLHRSHFATCPHADRWRRR